MGDMARDVILLGEVAQRTRGSKLAAVDDLTAIARGVVGYRATESIS